MVVHLLQTKLKKKIFFFEKMFFYKIYIICRKNVFLWKKKFYIENFFSLIFTEKNLNLIWEIYFYAENVRVTIKYKSFLNVYSFCKKIFLLIIKNIFVKTSLWTKQSGP